MQVLRQGSHDRAVFSRRSLSGLGEQVDGMIALFSSPEILPVQFYCSPESPYHEMGEVALMRAVLQDAITCFQRSAVSDRRQDQRLAREAEEWFFAKEDGYVFSLVNICAVLGLDPGYIRLGLKRWRQCPAARLRRGRLPMVRRSPAQQTSGVNRRAPAEGGRT